MKTEGELLAIEKRQMKMARKTATIFGVFATVTLIAIVFAFFQMEAAKRARNEASRNIESLLECQKKAEEAEISAQVAARKAEEAMIAAMIAKEDFENKVKLLNKKK